MPKTPGPNRRRILMVCDSDSNIGFSSRFAAHARERGVEAQVAFCSIQADLALQAAHASGGGDDIFIVSDWRRLFESPSVLDFDAIFVMITGKDVPRFCDSLRKAALTYGLRRPRTIGGFIGEWISGEAQVTERTGLDYFIVNRADELALFKGIASKFGFGCQFVHIPYPFVVRYPWARPLAQSFAYSPAAPIVFAEQVQVPRSPEERKLLFRTLVELARRYPERDVLFCERELPMGGTRHRAIGGIDEFFDDLEVVAPNLRRLPGGFRASLPNASIIVSVSSTACIEALINGVPAIFIDSFSASGADKFTKTGTTTDLGGLFEEQVFTISDAFYRELSDSDAWNKVLDLALAGPARREGTPPPMLGSFTHQYTRSVTARETLFEATGRILPVRDLAARNGRLGFAEFAAFVSRLSPGDCARARISDVARARTTSGEIHWATAGPEGNFTIALEGTSFAINLGVAATDIKEAVLSARCDVTAFSIRIAGGKVASIDGIDPLEVQVDFADLQWSTGPAAVLRLRSFKLLTLEACTIQLKKKGTWVESLAIEPCFYPSDPRVLAHVIETGDVPLSPGKDLCLLIAPARWRALAPKTELARVETRTGDATTVSITHDGSIEVAMGDPAHPALHRFASNASNTILLFSTSTLTAVIVNENVLVVDRPAFPATLRLAGATADAEPCFDIVELYEAQFAPGVINRTIELFTLRVFANDAEYAKKHAEIPDFRATIEERVGKPAGSVESAARTEPVARPESAIRAEPFKAARGSVFAAPSKLRSSVIKPAGPIMPATGDMALTEADVEAVVEIEAQAETGDREQNDEPERIAMAATPPRRVAPGERIQPLYRSMVALPVKPPMDPEEVRATKSAEMRSAQNLLPPVLRDPEDTPPPAMLRPPTYVESSAAFEKGDYELAARISSAAIGITPTSTKHRWLLARALNRLDHHAEALEQTARLIEMKPQEPAYRELHEKLLAQIEIVPAVGAPVRTPIHADDAPEDGDAEEAHIEHRPDFVADVQKSNAPKPEENLVDRLRAAARSFWRAD